MKDSSSCAIYGIKDSQTCTAQSSLHCVLEWVCDWGGTRGRAGPVNLIHRLRLHDIREFRFLLTIKNVCNSCMNKVTSSWLHCPLIHYQVSHTFCPPLFSSFMHLYPLSICFTFSLNQVWHCVLYKQFAATRIPNKQWESDPCRCLFWCHPSDLHFTLCRGYN